MLETQLPYPLIWVTITFPDTEREGNGGEPSLPSVGPQPRPSAGGEDLLSTDRGKIVFKKPAKRKSSDSVDPAGGVLDATTSKRPRQGDGEEKGHGLGPSGRRRRRSSGGNSQSKGVKNKSLLSFGGDDEDEDT